MCNITYHTGSYEDPWNGKGGRLFTSFFEEQNVTYYNFNKARLVFLQEKILTMADKEGHMGGELAERYSEVLAEVIKGSL